MKNQGLVVIRLYDRRLICSTSLCLTFSGGDFNTNLCRLKTILRHNVNGNNQQNVSSIQTKLFLIDFMSRSGALVFTVWFDFRKQKSRS